MLFQILFECAEVLSNMTKDEMLNEVQSLVTRLEKYYFDCVETGVDEISEGRKALAIDKMNFDLKKKGNKIVSPLWTMQEVKSKLIYLPY